MHIYVHDQVLLSNFHSVFFFYSFSVVMYPIVRGHALYYFSPLEIVVFLLRSCIRSILINVPLTFETNVNYLYSIYSNLAKFLSCNMKIFCVINDFFLTPPSITESYI